MQRVSIGGASSASALAVLLKNGGNSLFFPVGARNMTAMLGVACFHGTTPFSHRLYSTGGTPGKSGNEDENRKKEELRREELRQTLLSRLLKNARNALGGTSAGTTATPGATTSTTTAARTSSPDASQTRLPGEDVDVWKTNPSEAVRQDILRRVISREAQLVNERKAAAFRAAAAAMKTSQEAANKAGAATPADLFKELEQVQQSQASLILDEKVDELLKDEFSWKSSQPDDTGKSYYDPRLQPDERLKSIFVIPLSDDQRTSLTEESRRILSLANADRTTVRDYETQEVMRKFQRFPGDTGLTEVQIAALTVKILYLDAHIVKHKKDKFSKYKRTLLMSKRHKLLKYLKRESLPRYVDTIKALKLESL